MLAELKIAAEVELIPLDVSVQTLRWWLTEYRCRGSGRVTCGDLHNL
jgi:hypothetical protein